MNDTELFDWIDTNKIRISSDGKQFVLSAKMKSGPYGALSVGSTIREAIVKGVANAKTYSHTFDLP